MFCVFVVQGMNHFKFESKYPTATTKICQKIEPLDIIRISDSFPTDFIFIVSTLPSFIRNLQIHVALDLLILYLYFDHCSND